MRMGPGSVTGVLRRQRFGHRPRRHREQCRAETEAEAGGRRPQAKDCLEPPETEKEPRIDPPKGPHMKHGPTDILISEFSPVEVWEKKFQLLETTEFEVICYGSRTLFFHLSQLWPLRALSIGSRSFPRASLPPVLVFVAGPLSTTSEVQRRILLGRASELVLPVTWPSLNRNQNVTLMLYDSLIILPPISAPRSLSTTFQKVCQRRKELIKNAGNGQVFLCPKIFYVS